MNIVVCVKQVPSSNEVKLNPETNTIIRDGVKGIINPFDTYAIEEALRVKEKLGGKVTAISMGIPSVAETLKETIALGVDDAVLLTDRAFAGADTLATSYTLSMGIKKTGDFDLIICGRQATDGDTAQVGPSLAQKLGIPHVTCVKRIEQIDSNSIRCERITEYGYEVVELKLPALITVVKEINEPRLPSILGVLNSKSAQITIWSSSDIDAEIDKCGIKGSPTQVVKTFVPTHNNEIHFLSGSASEQVANLIDKLNNYQVKNCS